MGVPSTCDRDATCWLNDPLPALVSACSVFGWPAEIAVRELHASLLCLESVAAHAKIYRYETATSPSPAAVRLVLREVGMPIGWARAVRLSRRWGRGRARKLSEQLRATDLTHDVVSLLHPGHVEWVRRVDDETLSTLGRAIVTMEIDRRVRALEARAR